MRVGKRLLVLFAALALLLGILPSGFSEEKALYTAVTADDCFFREQPTETAKMVTRVPKGKTIEILRVDPKWALVRYAGKTGYVVRTQFYKVAAIDPVNTPPYGVFKHTFMAVAAGITPVLHAPQADAEAVMTLTEGAKVSILDITDGWARVPFRREYAYIDTRNLKELTPVSATDTPRSGETPIAAFTSYYKVVQTKDNKGRMNNIHVACERLSRVIEPGEVLDFNAHIGPYNRKIGYMEAPILADGGTKLGYGGGTCQVSSTLYNTIMQLPHITVLRRVPHGPGGIYYLPHGMDAAVGNDTQNLRFQNDYDFPLRVEASAQDGALFICIWKQ